MCVSFFSPLTPRVSLHRPCFRATVTVTDNNDNFTIDGRSQGNWLEERDIHCYLSIIVNWENTYCLSSLCTRESKLRAFQFKFLHRKIATNDFLYKIGIKQIDSCSFCEEQKEALVHLFWTCKYTPNFWKSML